MAAATATAAPPTPIPITLIPILVTNDVDAQDSSHQIFYHSITAMTQVPAISSKSFEELRALHYSVHRDFYALAACRTATKQKPPLAIDVKKPEAGSRKYRGPTITFKVGEESPELFLVHGSVLTGASDFVRLALQRDWQEATSRVIPLPEDEPDIFEIYQAWLYDRSIYTQYWLGAEEAADEAVRLLKAWILGDKLMDGKFKDAIMDVLIGRMNDTGSLAGYRRLAGFVYSKTPDGSPPRRLITVTMTLPYPTFKS